MALKEIFCQETAIAVLKHALASRRIPHAYIFAGPEGVGKFTTARQWAKLLLCQSRITNPASGIRNDSCGKCESCLKFEAGAHPDFQRVYKELLPFTREAAGKTSTPIDLPIDVIREFLIEKVGLRPTFSQRSVFVVEEAQKLNPASQNAMLKTLEEPPPYCSIILLCTRLDELLPTTLSRCQIVNFGPIDEDIIVEKLNLSGVAKDEAVYWARFANGSLGTALQWSAVKLKEGSVYAIKKELLDRFAGYKLADTIDFAQWLSERTKIIAEAWEKKEPDASTKDLARRSTNGILKMLAATLNDVMKLNVGISEKLINEGQKHQIEELAKKYGPEEAAEGISNAYKSMDWLDASVNEKLIFEELLLNLVAKTII